MNIDYNAVLLEKVQEEYDAFIERLMGMKSEEVISHAYEKVMKEDIVLAIEQECLSQEEASVLCFEKNPLDYVYQEWMEGETSHMEMLRDTVEYAARKARKKYA